MVPPEQSADLRDYYSKHAKSDRLDSRMLARLPLLHPEGLRAAEGLGPADALRRATKLRASLVKRRFPQPASRCARHGQATDLSPSRGPFAGAGCAGAVLP
jgi:hypothetical protein